jgi:hypothetical protein
VSFRDHRRRDACGRRGRGRLNQRMRAAGGDPGTKGHVLKVRLRRGNRHDTRARAVCLGSSRAAARSQVANGVGLFGSTPRGRCASLRIKAKRRPRSLYGSCGEQLRISPLDAGSRRGPGNRWAYHRLIGQILLCIVQDKARR